MLGPTPQPRSSHCRRISFKGEANWFCAIMGFVRRDTGAVTLRSSVRCILILLAVAVAAPWLVVFILFCDHVTLNPVRFLEEYAKFAGALLTVSLSFYLVYAHWHEKEAIERANRAVSSFRIRLRQLLYITREVALLLEGRVADEKHRQSANSRLLGLRDDLAQMLLQAQVVEEGSWSEKLDARQQASLTKWSGCVRPAVAGLLHVPDWRYSRLLLLDSFRVDMDNCVCMLEKLVKEIGDAET